MFNSPFSLKNSCIKTWIWQFFLFIWLIAFDFGRFLWTSPIEFTLEFSFFVILLYDKKTNPIISIYVILWLERNAHYYQNASKMYFFLNFKYMLIVIFNHIKIKLFTKVFEKYECLITQMKINVHAKRVHITRQIPFRKQFDRDCSHVLSGFDLHLWYDLNIYKLTFT